MRVPFCFTLLLAAVAQEATCPEECTAPKVVAQIEACKKALESLGAEADCAELTFTIDISIPANTLLSSCTYPQEADIDQFAVMSDITSIPDVAIMTDLGGEFAQDARVTVDTTCTKIVSGTAPADSDPEICASPSSLEDTADVLTDGSIPILSSGTWLEGFTGSAETPEPCIRTAKLTGNISMTVTLTSDPAPTESSEAPTESETVPDSTDSSEAPGEPQPEGVSSSMVLGLAATATALAFLY
eukprot:Protomagalhaensia_wolfi_Nauph_80__541@NODE_1305_length_1597_cov_10628_385109_g1008_i0_p1_GENE_NODE_1305_length_1597_cov_10628_385109_g1008_i0NODE_1305_length_1597_cov_10628_385109_g1008_i0_p1_ORF_typecomplete_len244_score44_58Alpha_GJ/PF03229_13/3_6e03Alpha_GJ/PF03229_13/0_19_NODE_1305_length_1597_cov_10628_385109_g1008_i03741105